MRVPLRRLASAPSLMIALVAGLAVGGAGCNSPVASGSVDGKALFASACVTCHGPEGTPPASMAAQLGVRDLRSPEFRARATVALVEHQVRTGSPNKLMPSFAGALSEAQITAIATFVVRDLTSATAGSSGSSGSSGASASPSPPRPPPSQ